MWSTFAALVDDDAQLRANLLPDAWLVALAKAHGCRLATADRGFARFGGLDWFDPARTRASERTPVGICLVPGHPGSQGRP